MKNLFEKIKNINVFALIGVLSRLFLEFLIVLVWLRYFVKDFTIAIVSTMLVVVLFECVLFLINKKRRTKNGNKKETQKKIDDIAMTFLFSDDSQNLNFFQKLASKKHKATKKSKYVVVENPNKKVVLVPFFTYQNFSCDNLLFCINTTKKENPQKLVITTNGVDQDVFALAKHFEDFEIVVLDKTDTFFKLLKFYDCYPEINTKLSQKTKPSRQDILAHAFNRKRSKGYFFASCILLISSFVVRKNLYYIISSSLLLILALVSHFNPRFNKFSPNNVLD